MIEMVHVLLRLTETQDAVRRAQALLVKMPDDRAIISTLESLQKRAAKLEDAFVHASAAMGLEVCAYRIVPEDLERYPIRSLGQALESFQKWFSTLYDALRNGPKVRAKLAPETLEESALDFAFSFTGSLGIAMTVPSEKQLFLSDLERAMVKTTEMLHADDLDAIHGFSDELGRAAVQAFYGWLEIHEASSAGARIQWLRGQQEIASVRADVSRVHKVAQLIRETAAPDVTVVSVSGLLVGADTNKHTFHMVFKDADELRGTMSESIGMEETVELPQHYRAKIEKTSVANPATGQTKDTYHLLELHRIDQG